MSFDGGQDESGGETHSTPGRSTTQRVALIGLLTALVGLATAAVNKGFLDGVMRAPPKSHTETSEHPPHPTKIAKAPDVAPPPIAKAPEGHSLPENVPVPRPTPVATAPIPAPVAEPVSAASPLRQICPRYAVPVSAESLTTFDAQLCAIAACSDDPEATAPGTALVLQWRQLTQGLDRNACRHADRKLLSRQRAVDPVLEAISTSAIPERSPAREICRSAKEAALDTVYRRQTALRPGEQMPTSCPKAGAQLSAEVEAFAARYDIKVDLD